jgi:hypothetical protein
MNTPSCVLAVSHKSVPKSITDILNNPVLQFSYASEYFQRLNPCNNQYARMAFEQFSVEPKKSKPVAESSSPGCMLIRYCSYNLPLSIHIEGLSSQDKLILSSYIHSLE